MSSYVQFLSEHGVIETLRVDDLSDGRVLIDSDNGEHLILTADEAATFGLALLRRAHRAQNWAIRHAQAQRDDARDTPGAEA